MFEFSATFIVVFMQLYQQLYLVINIWIEFGETGIYESTYFN